MKKHFNIIIAGAGGIARAAGIILAEWSEVSPHIFIGNRTLNKAQKVVKWIENGITEPSSISVFHMPEEGITEEMIDIFNKGDIILDCLPGSLAPKIAGFAKKYNLHYANLTEYVAETNEIKNIAQNAHKGFVLQTGLAPGYINVLANGLFNQFCKGYQATTVDKLEFKVGALTDHAILPHYYGFTWSPVGVATEYVKDSIVLRNFKKTSVSALSEQAKIIIDGITYEEDLTSGGAADLPDALAGSVQTLDYKTLRYPGHYDWIKKQLLEIGNTKNRIKKLQERMENAIPHVEDDQIILYTAVEGKDQYGKLRRKEISKKIKPQYVGKHKLRAIQTTTVTPLLQSAQLLLESNYKGVILQSKIEPKEFLNGNFVLPVYGEVDLS